MRILALLLALSLLLTGCSWMSGHYSSVRPHTQSYVNPNRDTPTGSAATFLELRSILCDLVDQGQERGLILLPEYDAESLQEDIPSVVDYLQNTYPLGCYALEDIHWELGTFGSQRALRLNLSYRFSRNAFTSIPKVRSLHAARTLIHQAMADCSPLLVFQTTNVTDTDFHQIIQEYTRSNPDVVMEAPQVILSTYPDDGSIRVVEIQFSYLNSKEDLLRMQTDVQKVVRSSTLYLVPNQPPMQHYQQLYTFLMERFDYTLGTSNTPAYSLLLHGVGDSRAFASVFTLLCQKANLTCQTVTGTRNGENWHWNLIFDGQQYYHVDLLQGTGFTPTEDWNMQGYVWNYSAYPASIPPET